ncbi:MAG: right-handed parallel beta-helix repeat-containing protein, partial [Kiritimatiellae bacterium]|nr:right-handed parallel beta-helix repeat-containing protein [Kiritimatiellia bacterium]
MKKLMMAVAACVCALGVFVGNDAVAGSLPSEYQEVEYIQSTGEQTINEIYTAGKDTKVEIDLMPQLTSSLTAIFGSNWGGGAWLFLTRDYTFRVYADGTSFGSGSAQVGNRYQAVLEYDHGVISNLTAGTRFQASGYEMGSGNTLKLFGMGNRYMAQYRLYGLKIYEKVDGEEVLKRDFCPCYTTIDDNKVAGLYDVVNATFYTNACTGADFDLGPDVDNFVDIVSDQSEAGEPICGTLVGYGRRTNLTAGEEVTCTMPETTVETSELGATLLGWKLEIFSAGELVSTTTNTADNLTTCTFTHVRGNTARITWRWKSKYRVTVVATGALTVSPEFLWVDGGGDVSFTATGGEAVWDGPGLDPKTRRSATCKLTNITGPTTVTVCPPNIVYVATNGVDEAGRGTAAAPYKTIKYAIDNTAAPLDVMVGDGTHTVAPADLPSITNDVRVIGESRDETIVYASNYGFSEAVFTLNHPYAVVVNVTVKILDAAYMGGNVGAAFDITSGTVTNVLCTECGSVGGTGVVNLCGDGAYFGDSVIDNCKLWNGASCMLSVSAGLAERIRITRTYRGFNDNSGCGVRLTGTNAVVRKCLIDKANLTKSVITTNCPAAYVSRGFLENCTIVSNSVKGSSNTGLYIASEDAVVRNCIITGNSGIESDEINVAFADDACRAAISYTCCPELVTGVSGNLSLDPRFTD